MPKLKTHSGAKKRFTYKFYHPQHGRLICLIKI